MTKKGTNTQGASSPANDLQRTQHLLARLSPIRRVGKFWHQLGPGLTTGAADDDPSGIATYSQTGSRYGFQLLWTAALTFPFMAIVQEICARIGLVTGRGLAANIRLHFPRWVLYVCAGLLFAANTFNIGADLGAMAEAAKLLSPTLSFGLVLIAFAVTSLLLQIFLPYARYGRFLKWLSLVLLAYVLTALTIRGLDWLAILRATVLPSVTFSRDQIILICGILGTTISPYLFFWQTSQEVEEEVLRGEKTIRARQLKVNAMHIRSMRIDVWSGMFFSNAVMFFIILACAAVLNAVGRTSIQTAADAAEALRPVAGPLASLLFAVGIIGVGLLAIPVLAGSAAYALSESFHWKEGLNRKLKDAYAFYGVIAVSMLIGLALNFIGLDPIKALIYSAIANGLVAPTVLLLVMIIGGKRKVMGAYVNGSWSTVFGWGITGVMTVVAVATVVSFFLK